MIDISLEKEKIIKSLNELEQEYNSGSIPKRHYISQKRQLTEQLETFEVADRVRRLQGKQTAEKPLYEGTSGEEEEEEALFKKYITSPGLKKKNIESKGISLNIMVGVALLAMAFIIGIGFGFYTLDVPEVSSASLFTNDSAFPPLVVNNTTNITKNVTKNITKNMTKNMTNIKKPVNTTIPKQETPVTPDSNKTPAAGEPTNDKIAKPQNPTPIETQPTGPTNNSSG